MKLLILIPILKKFIQMQNIDLRQIELAILFLLTRSKILDINYIIK